MGSVGLNGDEKSNTCETRDLRRVKSTQLNNTTRLSVQHENADGQRGERRDLSAWASLAKEAWRRVHIYIGREQCEEVERDVHQSSTLHLFSGPVCRETHWTLNKLLRGALFPFQQ